MNRLSNNGCCLTSLRAARPDTRTRFTISAGREARRTVPRSVWEGGAYALRLIVSCDEIDSLLIENAEEFVHGYVQKGGE